MSDDPTGAASRAGIRFRIEGRVQGVGFRWWAHHLARDLRLIGSVRNLEDGSVELVAAGSPDSIARLRSALNHGPDGATVTRVTESPLPAVNATSFEILR